MKNMKLLIKKGNYMFQSIKAQERQLLTHHIQLDLKKAMV